MFAPLRRRFSDLQARVVLNGFPGESSKNEHTKGSHGRADLRWRPVAHSLSLSAHLAFCNPSCSL